MDGNNSGNRKKDVAKGGKVNEMCREWLVREDGAFAYHLQAQEISQHYSGNKNRNQQVREDFPCALDEQIREQQLAEQAAAVYQRMLLEQEEVDEQIARDLAERLEREEEQRRRASEMRDENIARQMMQQHRDRDRPDGRNSGSRAIVSSTRVDRLAMPGFEQYVGNQPRRQAPQMPLPKSKMMDIAVQQRHSTNGIDHRNLADSTQQHQAKPPPKPTQQQQLLPGSVDDYHDLYTEPYQPPAPQQATVTSPEALLPRGGAVGAAEQLLERMDISAAKDKVKCAAVLPARSTTHHHSPPHDQPAEQQLVFNSDAEDELQRLQQEERDAEFARQLQEQETNSEESIMIRDRMLAMEAQDKELARLLQEREKAKARRAKERAKQRALQKKMALEHQSQQLMQGPDCILLPDDSYSNPADLLPPKITIPHTIDSHQPHHAQSHEDDAASNYSLPIDTLSSQQAQAQGQHFFGPQQSDQQQTSIGVRGGAIEGGTGHVLRPTHLDLRSTTQPHKISKPRYPDPPITTQAPAVTSPLEYQQQQHGSHNRHAALGYQQHTNIAMAIDPTYGRRHQQHYQQQQHAQGLAMPDTNSPSATLSSNGTPLTPATTTSSSSATFNSSCSSNSYPHHMNDSEQQQNDACGSGDSGSPVPPYMPIQGQRRGPTTSIEHQLQQQLLLDVGAGGGGAPVGKGRKKGGGGREGGGGGGGCKQQ